MRKEVNFHFSHSFFLFCVLGLLPEMKMKLLKCRLVVELWPLSSNQASFFLLSQTGEKRNIYHFHYTTWPDFGVPESPASFLNFLLKVRESGALGLDHGPAVVHCSAGIGRSGTFSLVDTCVVLVGPVSSF